LLCFVHFGVYGPSPTVTKVVGVFVRFRAPPVAFPTLPFLLSNRDDLPIYFLNFEP
jgi:hypothetical protein